MLAAAPLATAPLYAQPAKTAAYKAPRLSYGQPSLEGYWTNGSLTTETRPAKFGDRLVMTPEEVRQEESDAAKLAVSDNGDIDPNAPAPSVGGDLPAGQTQFSGAGGNVGGYDRGWLDPGASVMRVGGEPRTSFLTTPNGRPPARKAGPAPAAGGRGAPPPAAAARGATFSAFDNPETRGAGERCLTSFGRNTPPPMLPNGFYNNNYQIVQSPNAVAIVTEMVHDARIIPLAANKTSAKHRTDGVRPYFGDSIGWWEGDTLVVETTNYPRSQAYNGSWENLKVTERFTRTAKDRLRYKYTIEDNTTWDAPWGGEYEFAPLDGIMYEYACHEGNYALEGILAGAREGERVAAEQARGRAAR
jgi:hypothetical protein